MNKTNPNEPDSMRHFQKLLIDYGVIKELRKQGLRVGFLGVSPEMAQATLDPQFQSKATGLGGFGSSVLR